MNNILKSSLLTILILNLSSCAEKQTELNKNNQNDFYLNEEKKLVMEQIDKLKPCDEFTTIKIVKDIKNIGYYKKNPILNESLSVNHIIETNSYQEGVEYTIKACIENDNIKIIKLIKYYLPQEND